MIILCLSRSSSGCGKVGKSEAVSTFPQPKNFTKLMDTGPFYRKIVAQSKTACQFMLDKRGNFTLETGFQMLWMVLYSNLQFTRIMKQVGAVIQITDNLSKVKVRDEIDNP